MKSHKWNIVLAITLGVILSFSTIFLCGPSEDILPAGHSVLPLTDISEYGCPFSVFVPRIFIVGGSGLGMLIVQIFLNYNTVFYFGVMLVILELIRSRRIKKYA